MSEAGSTLHEFGHFIHYILGFQDEVEQLYADEADTAAIFLRDYAMTSSREFFADYFVHYLECADDTEKMEQLERITPKTFALFQTLKADIRC